MYVTWSGRDHSSSGWHVINLSEKKMQRARRVGGEKKQKEETVFPEPKAGRGGERERQGRTAHWGRVCSCLYWK